MSHVLARVRDLLIEFTVNTNLLFRTGNDLAGTALFQAQSFQGDIMMI